MFSRRLKRSFFVKCGERGMVVLVVEAIGGRRRKIGGGLGVRVLGLRGGHDIHIMLWTVKTVKYRNQQKEETHLN